jgi:hypothetical protein
MIGFEIGTGSARFAEQMRAVLQQLNPVDPSELALDDAALHTDLSAPLLGWYKPYWLLRWAIMIAVFALCSWDLAFVSAKPQVLWSWATASCTLSTPDASAEVVNTDTADAGGLNIQEDHIST